jgi:hypothetical protein
MKTGDITINRHGGNQLSMEAYLSIADKKNTLRIKVVSFVKGCGYQGATSDEVEQELDMPHQTASARMTEALAKNELRRNGERRKTRSGRSAAVLIWSGL